ncbi:MAG: nucleotide-binding protein [Betaproteobacteria bacterium]|nr:nucleotide-binding protein [Betaproteobacteria bacterium]
MKMFFSVLMSMLLTAGAGWAADKPVPPPAAPVKGEVLEVRDVETYTYLRLKTKDGETWAAVPKTAVKKGAEITIENALLMTNFESKSMKKTFDRIVFGSLADTGGADMTAAHARLGKPVDVGDVKVPKASGPDARTVAEIVTGKDTLKDKTVLVRGKVVKFNSQILGRNWIHLRDGSGSASDNTHDVLVTTKDQAKIGDVVVAKGVVHTDKDLGSGYSYKVLIEEATLQR